MKSNLSFPPTIGTSVPGTDWLESPAAKSWATQFLQTAPPAFGTTERHRALQQLEINQATRYIYGKAAKSPEVQAADDLQIEQQLAILSPIRCLPLELLSQIFKFTLDSDASFPDTASCVLGLTLVSHIWRTVAFSTASLWTKVMLYEGYARTSAQLAATPAALVAWLSHTKKAPLEIMLSRKGRTPDKPQVMWDAISPHLNHVASLDISLKSLSPAQQSIMWMQLEVEGAPLLRTLRIEGFDDQNHQRGKIGDVPCLSQISELTLKNVIIPLKLLFGCQNLKSLKIDYCIDSDASLDTTEDTDQDAPEEPNQQLPLLETLEISRDYTTHIGASVSLFLLFTLSPLLRTVTCSWYCQFIPHVFGAADLTRLNIGYEPSVGRSLVSREQLVVLFQELPSLEELSISVSEFSYQGPDTLKDTSVVLDVLAFSPWLCPCLREIKFECLELDKELLLSMSEKRSAEKLPVRCRVTTIDCMRIPDVTGVLHAELEEAIERSESGSSLSDLIRRANH